MYHEVTIGQGDEGTTTIHVFDLPGTHNISQNSRCYRISDLIFGCDMTIFKNTPEGKLLTSMIERNVELYDVEKWLNATLLKNIDTDVLMRGIEEAKQEAFKRGRKDKAAEIRAALYF
jgi:hypothetical protein